jgi:hypothetical protein
MPSISKSSLIYLFLIACLSFVVVHTAIDNRKSFDHTNIPVYDGVLYEFQQLKRYQKFEGDFGLKNRISQSIYEYQGNPVGGLYTVLLTFFAPSFLQNDIDLLLRSFLGLFVFNVSLFLILRKKYSNWWAYCILLMLSQLPLLYHYRIGLGSYTPELIGAVYLLGGYLLLIHFLKTKKIIFFSIGLISFLFPLAFRFNFFAYAFLLSLPLIVLFIREYSKFTRRILRNFLVIGILIIGIFLINFFYHFKVFYSYYTTVCYAIGNLEASLIYYSQNIKELYSTPFLVLFFIAIIGNSLFKNEKEVKFLSSFWFACIFLAPYLIYSIFVLFVMNSTNTPHIMSISLFFGILIIPIISVGFFKTKNINFRKFQILISVFTIVFCCTSFINTKHNNSERKLESQYETQRFTINYLKKHSVKSMFNCYDAMLDIPINTSLYNEKKIMIPYTGSFVTNDVYLRFSCRAFQACLAHYVDQVKKSDLIVINELETDPYILPMAKSIRIKLRKQLKVSKIHKLVLRKYFSFYGPILFYRLK